jgi:hypothetical protein
LQWKGSDLTFFGINLPFFVKDKIYPIFFDDQGMPSLLSRYRRDLMVRPRRSAAFCLEP